MRPSLLALTDRERTRWRMQTPWCENRAGAGVVVVVVVQNISTAPSGFASTLPVAAAPDALACTGAAQRSALAGRAGLVMGMAAETFNDGLRAYYMAYYMAFAATVWFVSPLAFMAAAAGVVWIHYGREFHFDVLAVLAVLAALADSAAG